MFSSDGAEGLDAPAPPPSADLLSNLQIRANVLLSELRAYQALLKSQKKQQEVEIRVFKRGVESEVKSLEKIARMFAHPNGRHSFVNGGEEGDDVESPQLHALRSSNLPFYEAVWAVAKSSSCITALGKRMYFTTTHRLRPEQTNDNETIPGESPAVNDFPKKGVLVDIVAENGLEWIKVSTLTEKRLLFEVAKQGWESYGDVSDVDESGASDDGASVHGESIGKLELVRVAEDLCAASKEVRVHFRHPRIRFVLPKIQEGSVHDVDAFLADLRATGAIIQCGGTKEPPQPLPVFSDIVPQCSLEGTGIPDLEHLMPSGPTVSLTETINVDCTILLALISDISHAQRHSLFPSTKDRAGTFHKAILRQIENEEKEPLLPTEIYPIMSGRTLECTVDAAQRMREIVQCMGTASEQNRADLILGEGLYESQSASILRKSLAETSIHLVPHEIRLPIKVVDFDEQQHLLSALHSSTTNAQIISIAARAKARVKLSPLNSAVFLYGWTKQIVTLTSNRSIASGLLRAVNELLDQDEHSENESVGKDGVFTGPLIYVCETARSLIGKEKSK